MKDEETIDNLIKQLQDGINSLEEIRCYILRLQDEIDELKADIEENYELKRRNPYVEYDIREDDFH